MTSARLRAPQVRIDLATTADIAGIVAVRVNAAEDLTERFGGGHWSGHATERGVALDVRQGLEFLKKQPGIEKIVLLGHSGGGPGISGGAICGGRYQ